MLSKAIMMKGADIFSVAGMPKAIIKDCDYTLQKGVRLWEEQQEVDMQV